MFIEDDVLAFNFRAALALSMAKGKPEMDELQDEAAAHRSLEAQADAAAARWRAEQARTAELG